MSHSGVSGLLAAALPKHLDQVNPVTSHIISIPQDGNAVLETLVFLLLLQYHQHFPVSTRVRGRCSLHFLENRLGNQ
jgi:hypothetical protein